MAEFDPGLLDNDRTAPSPLDADTLFRVLEQDLDRTVRLAERTTPLRRGLAFIAFIAVGAVTIGAQGIRPDLDAAGWRYFAVFFALLTGSGLWAAAASLRPLHQHGWRWGVALTAWLSAIAIAMSGVLPGLQATPDPRWSFHLYCLGVTSTATVALVSATALLDRGQRLTSWRVASAAGGAGLFAFAVQSVFCPIAEAGHLFIGHGGAGWMIGMLVAGLLTLRR